jgi:hypothetical protein
VPFQYAGLPGILRIVNKKSRHETSRKRTALATPQNGYKEMGTKMKINRIAIIAALALIGIVLSPQIAKAQAPETGPWDILATSETDKNTSDGTPLQIITDWKSTTSGSTTTIAPVVANSFTNSNCTASGQPSSLTVAYNSSTGVVTAVATMDYGQTITFTSTKTTSNSTFSGTFTSTGGGCTNSDSGNFTATYYAPLSGSLSGTIESYMQTNTINVSVSLSTDSNFNVTGTLTSTNKTCMASLTIDGTAAQAYGPSIVTGDTEIIYASDTTGDVVGLIFSATDQNGVMLSPAWPKQAYVTYQVLAGPCAGDGGTDAPFHQVEKLVPHAPIHPRMPIGFKPFPNPEQTREIEVRK